MPFVFIVVDRTEHRAPGPDQELIGHEFEFLGGPRRQSRGAKELYEGLIGRLWA